MKVEILRTPGLDLVHDLAAKGVTGPVEVPKDLVEGETKDLDDDVAEALIAVGVARQADKPDKGGKHAPAHPAHQAKDAHPAHPAHPANKKTEPPPPAKP